MYTTIETPVKLISHKFGLRLKLIQFQFLFFILQISTLFYLNVKHILHISRFNMSCLLLTAFTISLSESIIYLLNDNLLHIDISSYYNIALELKVN